MFSQWGRAADCIFPCLYTSSQLHSTAFEALKVMSRATCISGMKERKEERKSGTN